MLQLLLESVIVSFESKILLIDLLLTNTFVKVLKVFVFKFVVLKLMEDLQEEIFKVLI